jgi:hypothetical protein
MYTIILIRNEGVFIVFGLSQYLYIIGNLKTGLMRKKQKEEQIITILLYVLVLITLFLIAKAVSAAGTPVFAPLIIIIVLLCLITAALFYHNMLLRKVPVDIEPAPVRRNKKEEAGTVAELERKLFGDITETMNKISKK